MPHSDDPYRTQHKKRLNYMPWLYFTLKPKHKIWAAEWQHDVQAALALLENIHIEDNCFIASNANIFAEPGRDIFLGQGSFIGADCYLHGPIKIGSQVSINQHCKLEGSRAGICIGDNTRIAAGCAIYAFEHGINPINLVSSQPVTSSGIKIGNDVWIGANCGIVDGVTIGNHAVVGMNSTVTKDIEPYAIMAGAPAKKIGDRRDKVVISYQKKI